MSLASELNRRITILRPPGAEDVDEYGEPVSDDWMPFERVWASIQPLSGRQLESAKQIHADVTTKIVMRFRKGIDRTMIAKHDGVEFEFLYIIHKDFARKELHIMAKERQ